MNNLAIDQTTKDLLEIGGQIQETDGATAIGQVVSTDLKTFLGELWLDKSFGIPYYELVFKKGVDLSAIKSMYVTKILAREDVLSINKFELNIDNANRTLRILFDITVTGGQTVTEVVEV